MLITSDTEIIRNKFICWGEGRYAGELKRSKATWNENLWIIVNCGQFKCWQDNRILLCLDKFNGCYLWVTVKQLILIRIKNNVTCIEVESTIGYLKGNPPSNLPDAITLTLDYYCPVGALVV